MSPVAYKITNAHKQVKGIIFLTASKSESNRVLLIQALSGQRLHITNLSDSKDTQILEAILKNETAGEHCVVQKKMNEEVSYYTGHGGTTIRFLTAFFAARPGIRILNGSDRMNQRPIKPLVDALEQLGAKITYLKAPGCTPLKIEGTVIEGGDVEMDAGISSQFITSLLLVAPTFKKGLNLTLTGQIASRSYIKMTLKVLEHFGITYTWTKNTISIPHQEFKEWHYHIEPDWSSASYWYEMAALAEEAEIIIKGLRRKSIQGDSVLANLFEFFGVHTEFTEDGIRITKTDYRPEFFDFDFSDYPDIAQTAAVVASALRIPMQLNGLNTLYIKETDRVKALKNELKKIGVDADDRMKGSLRLSYPEEKTYTQQERELLFKTYQDHRMAMAFAPLALIYPNVIIEEPSAVKKSYPDYWNDMKRTGFEILEEI